MLQSKSLGCHGGTADDLKGSTGHRPFALSDNETSSGSLRRVYTHSPALSRTADGGPCPSTSYKYLKEIFRQLWGLCDNEPGGDPKAPQGGRGMLLDGRKNATEAGPQSGSQKTRLSPPHTF